MAEPAAEERKFLRHEHGARRSRVAERTALETLVQFLLDGQETVRWTAAERRVLANLRYELHR